MGIKLKWDRVLEIAGEAAPGRPHVAEALVEAGHVANFREAFARYLHNDGPAYVEVKDGVDHLDIIDDNGLIAYLVWDVTLHPGRALPAGGGHQTDRKRGRRVCSRTPLVLQGTVSLHGQVARVLC